MENPVKQFIENRGLTGLDLASLSGMSPTRIYAALAGVCRRIPRPILLAIEQAGDDIVQVQNDYARYREWKRTEIREKAINALINQNQRGGKS